MKKVLGIILARAGSVGLAGKHLLPLLGRPVIEYTFEHARVARRLTHLALTTDCARIRLLAQNFNIPSIERPPKLATASATVQAACLHAMHWFESRFKLTVDAVVVLYGNVPVRPPGVIDRAVELLEATGCDSVRSLIPVGKWHPAWMHRLEGNVMRPLMANSVDRRQDLEPLYLHDGAAIAVTRASMLRGEQNPGDPHAFFGEDRRAVLCELDQTVEIDHRRDIYLAEAVLRARQEGVTLRRAS